MSKEITLVSPELPKIGSIPLITQRDEESPVTGEDDSVFIQFKGIVLLGIPYGVMYWKPVTRKDKLRAVKRVTMLGNMPDLLSVTERSGIMTREKFDELPYDEKFDNVLIVAM